jgi:hypothetical protein
MAVTVKIKDPGLKIGMTLDPQQTTLFLEELRRVTGFFSFSWLRGLLMRMFGVARKMPLMAPDLLIEVERGGFRREYEVVGSWILRHRSGYTPHQFYFAVLLVEWLKLHGNPTP